MLPRRSRQVMILGLFLLVALNHSAANGQDAKKKPIPASAAQAKFVKLIQELYQDELAKAAKDPAVKVRLAQTLLQEGKDTADDAAGRYVLYTHAHQLAAEAGDVATALQAAEELAQDFQIPASELFQMKIGTLATAASAPKAAPDAYQTVIDGALLLIEDTLAADDFKSSLALLAAADRAALRLRNVPLVASIRKRQEEVAALQKEYARWEPFAGALAKNPEDAIAGQEIGFYHALIKGNWEKGLPLLARGKDGAATIAQSEIAAKTSAQLAAAAEQWYAFGAKMEGTARTQALLHAHQLYLQALADADVSQHEPIEGRLQAIMKELPAEHRVGEITSEARKIDLAGPVYDGAISPDGKKLLIAAYDGSLRLLDSRTAKELRRLDGHLGKVWTVAFIPDGRRALSGGFDGSVRIWDLTTGRELRRFPGHTDYVRCVTISQDGKTILSGGDDKLLRLWDVETGKEARLFPGHDHFVWSVALSRDGKRALSGSLDKTVRVWSVESGKEILKLPGHADTVLAVAFSPDGRRALSGSSDKTLKLWDLETGSCLTTFTGHTGYVQSVAFAPDGRRVLSAGADNTVRLWDAATGKEVRKLEGHQAGVWSVAFSRDGRLALSTGQDHSVRVWTGAK